MKNNRLRDCDYVTSPHDFQNIPDLSDIDNNPDAQRYLLKRITQISREALFEEVYQAKLAAGEELIFRKGLRKAFLEAKEIQEEPSFLSPERERRLSEADAMQDTAIAMTWLDKELEKSHVANANLVRGANMSQ